MPHPISPGVSTALAYAAAGAIGLAYVVAIFPTALLAGALPAADTAFTDTLQHVTGQIAFFATPWHRPLLNVPLLAAPAGVNIAMTDSIPLEAILLKLVHPLVPGLHQGISAWQALCKLAQPVAAVFALRSFNERRLLPALAIALIALSMPTFELRMWHTALASHFLLLIAIGLYGRCTRRDAGKPPFVAFALLLPASLAIHPYLTAMVASLLVALPVSLGLNRDPAWKAAATALVAGIAATFLTGAALGEWGANGGAGGFAFFSMNLASPLWPARSALMPFVPGEPADATGGQSYEGYQYLGAGLILLLLATLAHPNGRARLAASSRRHLGLALVLAGLTVYATSNRVWLFHHRLIYLQMNVPLSQQLRADGRLFWPVAYVLLVVAVLRTAQLRARLALVLLPLAAALQFADVSTIRQGNRDQLARMLQPPGPVAAGLDRTLAAYREVELFPRIECGTDQSTVDMPLIYLATIHGLPTNSMYAARDAAGATCGSRRIAAAWPNPPAPTTLLAFSGPSRIARALAFGSAGGRCAALPDQILCSTTGAALDGPPPPGLPPIPSGRLLGTAIGGAGTPYLADGWSNPEAWGTWSDSGHASIVLPATPADRPRTLALLLHAAPFPDGGGVDVTVTDRTGRTLAAWSATRTPGIYRVALPPAPAGDVTVLDLALSRTVTPGMDPRNLGLALLALELTT